MSDICETCGRQQFHIGCRFVPGLDFKLATAWHRGDGQLMFHICCNFTHIFCFMRHLCFNYIPCMFRLRSTYVLSYVWHMFHIRFTYVSFMFHICFYLRLDIVYVYVMPRPPSIETIPGAPLDQAKLWCRLALSTSQYLESTTNFRCQHLKHFGMKAWNRQTR